MLCDLADDANETQTQYVSCADGNGIQAEMVRNTSFLLFYSVTNNNCQFLAKD